MVGLANRSSGLAAETTRSLPGGPDCSVRRPRRDALPEHTDYVDTGCDLHPSCLSCPLVRCRYDEPGGARRLISDERDREIVRLRRDADLPIGAIAARFGVSRRTVFRVLARDLTRDEGG